MVEANGAVCHMAWFGQAIEFASRISETSQLASEL
jgi:hypothetical protein